MHLAIVRQAIYTRSCSPFMRWNLLRLLTSNYAEAYFLTKPVKVVVIIWCKGADFSVILEIKEIFNVCLNVKSEPVTKWYPSIFLKLNRKSIMFNCCSSKSSNSQWICWSMFSFLFPLFSPFLLLCFHQIMGFLILSSFYKHPQASAVLTYSLMNLTV